MKLLEKAMSFETKKYRKYIFTDEELELAIAFIKGLISDKQTAYALGYKLNYIAPIRQKLMSILKYAYLQGRLEIKIKNG